MQLPGNLTISDIQSIGNSFSISANAKSHIATNRQYLDKILTEDATYYGINTGFGSLCNVKIEQEELAQLQENLVCSHACGMGAEVPEEIVRLMMLLKVHGLAQGYSGVRPELVQRLVDFYNEGIHPVVYEQGSLGASGDLAPLAHLSLPLIGKGWVNYKGQKRETAAVLFEMGMEPLALAAKEGLALLNGTQFMSAYAVHNMIAGQRLMQWADIISALSADAFMVKAEPFKHSIHRVRPHKGQVETAHRIQGYLGGSQLQKEPRNQVQDPYSFRCIPQVHGATKDVLRFAQEVIETEINSVTDNPIVFADENAIMSGGNFHGQPLAFQLDFMAIALAELANISERRTYLLVSGTRDLPPFLAPKAGLNSGFMIAQYTAAAIVSQNKGLCMPASVDSIVSSNGQEDHVSMGANAATKLQRVTENVQRVLAIELLVAAQALELRRPLKTSRVLENIFEMVREKVPFMQSDRVLHDDMVLVNDLLYSFPESEA